MIFYDKTQRRKIYFRLFTGFVIGAFIGGIGYVAFSLYTYNTSREYLEETRQYYDRYFSDPENHKKLVISFDDGPHPVYTRQAMEVLEKHGVPATFFLLGKNALQYPDVVSELDAKGFTIGNHTYSHSYDVHNSKKRLQLELAATERIISDITGKPTIFYRPPFLLDIGSDPTVNPETDKDNALVWAIESGYIPVGADVDSKDYMVDSVDAVVNNIKNAAPHGHFILLHDGYGQAAENTVAALDRIITEMQADGYEFVSIEEFFDIDPAVELTHELRPASNDQATAGRVSELQRLLQNDIDPDIRITGEFDTRTVLAISRWEQQNGVDLEHGFTLGSRDAMTDGEVSRLQKFLQENGAANLRISGYFDHSTEKALLAWQRQHDMPETEFGSVGPETRAAIKQVSLKAHPLLDQADSTSAQNTSFFAPLRQFLERTYISILGTWSLTLVSVMRIVMFIVIFRTVMMFGFFLLSLLKQKKSTLPWDKKVSVIIPAYNEEKNIAATVMSVLHNTYKNKEIIVVDDGSTDETAVEVEKLVERYPEIIRLLSIENGGKANALNVGIAQAKSEVVITMDGDTVFARDTIEHLVKHFGDETVGSVSGKVCVVDSDRLLGAFQSTEYIVGQNIEKRGLARVNGIHVVPGPIGAWRKASVIKCGGYSHDTLVEDQDLSVAIQQLGQKILYEPRARGFTETPATIRDFVKQRFRWVFGTLQCIWKYKRYTFSIKRPSLGFIILPNNILSNIIIPISSPIIDLYGLYAIIFGQSTQVIQMYLFFVLFDFLYCAIAFAFEKDNKRLLLYIPLQRLFYRFIMYYIIIKSVIKAIEGTSALWNKVRRTGLTQQYYSDSIGDAITN